MNQSVWQKLAQYMKEKKEQRIWKAGMGIAACLVVFCTVYTLILPAMTLEQEAFCGDPAHEHTLACYSDPQADTEDAAVWEAMLPKTSGDIRTDMVSIAESQVGYRESEKNYEVMNETELKGYTRYGAWAGDPYGDWNAYFTQFVMHYAGTELICSGDAAAMLHTFETEGKLMPASDQNIAAGDIVFYTSNGKTLVGVISAAKDGNITAVSGDEEGQVSSVTVGSNMLAVGLTATADSPVGSENDLNTDGTVIPEENNEIVGDNALPEETPDNGGVTGSEEGPVEEIQAVGPEDVVAWAQIQDETLKTKMMSLFSFRSAKAASVSMRDMITSVTIKYRDPQGELVELKPGGTVNENDEIFCYIAYTVPPNKLSATTKTIVYDLPVTVVAGRAQTGDVYNNSGQTVGHYEIKDGKVTIVFEDSYVEKNSNGQPIDGTVKVEGHLKNNGSGDSSKITIHFNDKISVDVNVKKDVQRDGHIQVAKVAEKQADSKLIKYTMTVSSEKGTYGPVVVTDNMAGSMYHSGLTVVDQNGNHIDVSEPKRDAVNFKFELPQMDPPKNGKNSTYTITYFASINESKLMVTDKGTRAKNKVNVTSTDSLGGELRSNADVITKFMIVSKTGSYDKAKQTITWTVDLNQDKMMDLSGMKLTDTIFGASIVTNGILTDSKGNKTSIDIPYTFPEGSTDSYQLTYETKLENNGQGITYVNNKVQLHRNQRRLGFDVEGVTVGNGGVVEKDAANAPSLQGDLLITPWKVTIKTHDVLRKGTDGNLVKDQYVKDTIPGANQANHYFTGAQLKAARVAIEKAAKDAGNEIIPSSWDAIQKTSWPSWDQIKDNEKYYGFQYAFDLSKSNKIHKMVYQYETTSVNTKSAVIMKNRVDLIGSGYALANTEYLPDGYVLRKEDPAFPGAPESSHYWHNVKNGILEWDIDLFIPAQDWNKPYVLFTEELPLNTELTSLYFFDNPKTEMVRAFKEDRESTFVFRYNGVKYHMPIEKRGNQLLFNFPNELTQNLGGQYHMTVKVKVDDTKLTWTNEEENLLHKASVTNTAKVVTDDGEINSSQTQVLIKDDMHGVLLKDGSNIQDNIVTYTIQVNPLARDLLKNGEILTLRDTLTIQEKPGLRCNLVPGSVKAEDLLNPGNPVPMLYQHTVDKNNPNCHELALQIPDERAIKISYKYKFSGLKVGDTVAAHNKADLEGISESEEGTSHDLNFAMSDSAATADVHGIEVYKVDKSNHGLYLEGAKFKLSHWNGSKYVPVQKNGVDAVFVTDSEGFLRINNETVGSEVAYNTAYRLEEVEAPTGYFLNNVPYDFYIYNQDDHTDMIPENFTGHKLYDGALVEFENERSTRNIFLVKKWIDVDGSKLSDPGVNEVTIKLYKKVEGEPKETLHGTYQVKNTDNWTLQISNLPKQNEQGKPYVYTVKEVNVPGFSVSYDETEISKGIITIKNQKEAGYQLPETGGPGIFWYLLTGAGLMIFSLLAYRRIHVK